MRARITTRPIEKFVNICDSYMHCKVHGRITYIAHTMMYVYFTNFKIPNFKLTIV